MLNAIAEEIALLDRGSRLVLTAVVRDNAVAVTSNLLAAVSSTADEASQALAAQALATWLAVSPSDSVQPTISPGMRNPALWNAACTAVARAL